MAKIKDRVTIEKCANGTYAVLHMTFCNGVTVNLERTCGLTREEARNLKNELKNL